MKSLFSSVLKFSAISTIALCGFFGCSGDSSSGSDDTGIGGDQGTPMEEIPQNTELAPIKPQPLTVEPNGVNSLFMINGGASLDLLDTTAIPTGAEVVFTKLQLRLGKVGADGSIQTTPLQITCGGQVCDRNLAQPFISLTELQANIKDDNKSDCGTFRIFATYYASYDANNMEMFIKSDSVDFTRPQDACEEVKQPEPQEVVVPGSNVALTYYTIKVNTKAGDGLSLATGTVVPVAQADIYFNSDELTDEIKMYTGNGFQLTEYINGDDVENFADDWTKDMLPPDPAHMSDFRFKTNRLQTSSDFTSYMFYIALGPNYNAETGDGFYAFTELDESVADANHNIEITLLVYKK